MKDYTISKTRMAGALLALSNAAQGATGPYKSAEYLPSNEQQILREINRAVAHLIVGCPGYGSIEQEFLMQEAALAGFRTEFVPPMGVKVTYEPTHWKVK